MKRDWISRRTLKKIAATAAHDDYMPTQNSAVEGSVWDEPHGIEPQPILLGHIDEGFDEVSR